MTKFHAYQDQYVMTLCPILSRLDGLHYWLTNIIFGITFVNYDCVFSWVRLTKI